MPDDPIRGSATALVGMRRPDRVDQNSEILRQPGIPWKEWGNLLGVLS